VASFVVTGGGTGGHLFAALAVGDALVARGHRVSYVGSESGLEARRPWDRGYARHLLPVAGLARKSLGTALRSVVSIPSWWFAGRRLLADLSPAVVVGFGGYAAAPMLFAARRAGVPIVLHESNATRGLVTRLFARAASVLCLGVPSETPANSSISSRGVLVTGNPVRPLIASLAGRRPAKANARKAFGLPARGRVLVIMPGSQGSSRLNALVASSLARLSELPRLALLWMSGEREHSSVEAAARHARLPSAVFPFIERVELAYSAADLFLGRSGSGTLAEIACAGLPSVLIPFPGAAGGHQLANARAFASAGAAEVREESALSTETLVRAISDALESRRNARMARAAASLARPGAADAIADAVERTANRSAHPGGT